MLLYMEDADKSNQAPDRDIYSYPYAHEYKALLYAPAFQM